MSIYASMFGVGYDHTSRCARMRKLAPKTYEQDDAKPCTCKSCPIEYQGSNVLPNDKDKRAGYFGTAAIPGHISHGQRRATNTKDEWIPYHPWLRMSMNQEEVVLDRKQVARLRDELTRWLKSI